MCGRRRSRIAKHVEWLTVADTVEVPHVAVRVLSCRVHDAQRIRIPYGTRLLEHDALAVVGNPPRPSARHVIDCALRRSYEGLAGRRKHVDPVAAKRRIADVGGTGPATASGSSCCATAGSGATAITGP